MIVTHGDRTIELLADPHLGKPFIHGVPLHRRGDREAMVWADFEASLQSTTADVHINLGDLFNAATVPYDVILRAARAYAQASQDHPETQFLILQGNHDVSRDLERVSAFDVFAEIVSGLSSIRVVREPVQIDRLLLVPFDPVTPTAALIEELEPVADLAFGHWDVEGFSDSHNLIPTRLLAHAVVRAAYTGCASNATMSLKWWSIGFPMPIIIPVPSVSIADLPIPRPWPGSPGGGPSCWR